MAATPARPEGAEYITAVDQLTQLIREPDIYSILDDHPRIEGMFNAVHEFQDLFQVGVKAGLNITLNINFKNNYSRSVPELHNVFWVFWSWPGPGSACDRLIPQDLDNFMEEVALTHQVSITEPLEDGKVGGGQSSICLSQFVFVAAEEKSSNKALVSASDNEEGEEEETDDSTAPAAATVTAFVHAAENNESQTVDIPVRLPCGHVFGRDCIRSWLSVCLVGKSSPTCPVCRSKLESLDDASTLFKRFFYPEVIRLPT